MLSSREFEVPHDTVFCAVRTKQQACLTSLLAHVTVVAIILSYFTTVDIIYIVVILP